jgi:hypothetical protein
MRSTAILNIRGAGIFLNIKLAFSLLILQFTIKICILVFECDIFALPSSRDK